jgi:hypothetical protein
MARKLFAGWPTGQKMLVELADEPWNGSQNQWNECIELARINGGDTTSNFTAAYWYYATRAGQCRTIFRNVWGPRASEVLLGYNVQWAAPSYAAIQQALNVGCQIDYLLVAPYIDAPQDGNAIAVFSSGGATIEQCVDMWTHGVNMSNSEGIAHFAGQWNTLLGTYNTATSNAGNNGAGAVLFGYEGGYQTGVPFTNHIAPTLTITQLNKDIQYDPTFAVSTWDMYALAQQNGFAGWNISTYNYPINYANVWGVFQTYTQLAGAGDGSDGLANNRLNRALTGLSGPLDYSGPSTGTADAINQDYNSVSVRMQAFKNWMLATSGGTTGTASVTASAAAITLGV